ncbi:MAG: CoA pyrophosphatase [Aestuariivita sp.]|nr:CoA pyrophosphatase [Aestuariivita sp.]MCY4202044.1 CoA pyrophosphatase [Aestuariivita sp.]
MVIASTDSKTAARHKVIRTMIAKALAKPADGDASVDLRTELPAAVLVPILMWHQEPQVLLTVRSSRLMIHSGQVAFPGGKKEPQDIDAVTTALREAREEIGLASESVNVMGQLPPHVTVTGYVISPVVAFIEQRVEFYADAREVEEIFTVPLQHLMHLGNYQVQRRTEANGLRSYLTIPYGPYYIWGATARILKSLAERVSH